MKNIITAIFLSSLLLLGGSGCLKDKAYENDDYGIVVKEVRGVAFPQASISPVVVGITGQAAPLKVAGPFITIEGDAAASADVTMKLAFSNALVTAKNLTPLPAGSYSLSTTDPVIKAGERSVSNIELMVNNSNLLDPNISYGVGITITTVSAGYQLAQNSKDMVIGFTIKNKYDGIYRLQGRHNRSPFTFPYDVTIHMVTTGPNSVIFYWPEVKSIGHPIGTGVGATSWYGVGIAPEVVFNSTTDLVTDVFNKTPGTVITMFTGAGAGISRFDGTVTPKKMYVNWNYNNNPLRAFFDTLTFISVRP